MGNVESIEVLQSLQNLAKNLLDFGCSNFDVFVLYDGLQVTLHEVEAEVEYGRPIPSLLVDNFVNIQNIGMV